MTILKFTLSDINVSLANAIRRTILSDIPTVIFKTFPYEKNQATIYINTSRLNNEILKQRLGCIPIHIKDDDFPIQDYIVEIEKKNNTDSIQSITTKDFKIKNIKLNKYITQKARNIIFPENKITKDHIIFARLRPTISKELPGEELKMSVNFQWGTAKENGMYNVVSTCSYQMTPDPIKQDHEWKKIEATLNLKKKELANAEKNWYLLKGKRFYIEDSFDFIIESVGVYSNEEIFKKACKIIQQRLKNIIELPYEIKISISTNTNSYDIKLNNEDHTIGKIIEYMLHFKYFKTTKLLNFVGFKKFHPHDTFSIIRIVSKEPTTEDTIRHYVKTCCEELIEIYDNLDKIFK